MKAILLGLAIVLSLSGCGRPSVTTSFLNYPCNFYYAPASDNGSKCGQCFPYPDAELSFMEKYTEFWGRNNPTLIQSLTTAEFGPTPGEDIYPLFMQVFVLSPSTPKGWCGQ